VPLARRQGAACSGKLPSARGNCSGQRRCQAASRAAHRRGNDAPGCDAGRRQSHGGRCHGARVRPEEIGQPEPSEKVLRRGGARQPDRSAQDQSHHQTRHGVRRREQAQCGGEAGLPETRRQGKRPRRKGSGRCASSTGSERSGDSPWRRESVDGGPTPAASAQTGNAAGRRATLARREPRCARPRVRRAGGMPAPSRCARCSRR
jgi:hypothetical protein